MTTGILFVVGWLACGVAAAGMTYAHGRAEYPHVTSRRELLGVALGFGLLGGPVALVVSVFMTGFCEHGWKLW